MKRIFTAFFGKSGVGPRGYGAKSGSFLGGLNQIFIELFGENNRIKFVFTAIRDALMFFADGLYDIVLFIKGEDEYGNKRDRLKILRDNFIEMLVAISALFLALTPRLFFSGIVLPTIGLAWKIGKGAAQWLILKPLKRSITSLLASLGFLAQGIDDTTAATMRGGLTGPSGAVKGRSYRLGGQTYRFAGRQFLTASGDVADAATQRALRQGIAAGNIKPMGAVGGRANYLAEMDKKFPKVYKAITKGVPFLGGL